MHNPGAVHGFRVSLLNGEGTSNTTGTQGGQEFRKRHSHIFAYIGTMGRAVCRIQISDGARPALGASPGTPCEYSSHDKT